MDKLELLQKIKALVNAGVGGEAINAKKKLEELMKKYNITEEELSDEIIEKFDIKVTGFAERKLLSQVVYSVCGDIDSKKGVWEYVNGKKNIRCVHCTKAEFLEIEAKFDFYKREFRLQQKYFLDSFIQANEIFPPREKTKPNDREYFLSEEDMKILKMSRGIEKSIFVKQIEN